ncbi:MAG: membrane dipeptidase, partial [Pirellulaceae bacterium]
MRSPHRRGGGLLRPIAWLGIAGSLPAADPQPIASPAAFTISAEAMAIHGRGYVWDGHNDLPWAMREAGDRTFHRLDIAQAQPKLNTDIPRLRRGNVGAQFWSVYVPAKERLSGTAFQSTMEQIGLVKAMVAKY